MIVVFEDEYMVRAGNMAVTACNPAVAERVNAVLGQLGVTGLSSLGDQVSEEEAWTAEKHLEESSHEDWPNEKSMLYFHFADDATARDAVRALRGMPWVREVNLNRLLAGA